LRGNHCSRPCGYGSGALSFLKLGHNRTSLIAVLFPSPVYVWSLSVLHPKWCREASQNNQ
jgi:hypothetical protein